MSIAEKLATVAENIPKVYAAGHDAGWEIGYTEGHRNGYTEGNDAMWDIVQNSGQRTSYDYAFYGWASEYVRPKYKVIPTGVNGVSNVFCGNKKLKKVEATYFDFSQKPTGTNNNTGYYYTFDNCNELEEIEDIGMIPQHSYIRTFGYCYKLHTIAKMSVAENTIYSQTFVGCNALVDLTIDGTIGQNGFDISYSKSLSAKSLKNIIDALSTTTTGLSVKLPNTAETNYNANPPEGAPQTWAELIATRQNWSYAYA